MQASWGSYTFLFYAALDVIMAIIVWFFVKETKGKSLEEMETIFNSRAAFDVEIARHEGQEVADNVSAVEVHARKKGDGSSRGSDEEDKDVR